MFLQSGIINCHKMYKISQEVKLYRENYENLKSGIDSRRKKQRTKELFSKEIIYQPYYSLLPWCHLTKYRENVPQDTNFVDHRKMSPTIVHGWYQTICINETELETIIHPTGIYSQDIGMEFGIEKCAMLVMKSGERHLTDGMELPNQDKIRILGENETNNYLGILEADTIKQVEMKNKIQKEYLRRTRNLVESKLSCRNLIKKINTWAVPLVSYSGPFLKLTSEELKQMDQRIRKILTMRKASQPRDDADRKYVLRKEGGRSLASIEDSVEASIRWLEVYTEKHEGAWLQPSEPILTTRWTTEWHKLETKMWRKTTLWAF